MNPQRSHRASDEGAMLIIALLVITTVSMVTGALLTVGNGKFATTVALRQVASTAYAADAAAKVAISDLELGSLAPDVATPGLPQDSHGSTLPWVYDNNVDGSGCFGASGAPDAPVAKSVLTLPSMYADNQSKTTYTATVTCSPVLGTGVFDSGPTNPITGGYSAGGPAGGGTGRALTITGTGTPALDLKVLGNGGNNQFVIHGDVVSAGQLSISNGNLYTDGTVTAASCSPGPSAVASQQTVCNGGSSVSDPLAGVAPNISAVPTQLGTWSGCVFQPGYYDDAKALTTATDNCTGGARFAPGTYYFDFHNNTADPTVSTWGANAVSANSTGAGSSYDVWTVNNDLIGGTYTSINSIPGRCINPIDNVSATSAISGPTSTGVQFVFGGDSQMYLNGDAQVELCAPKSSVTDQSPIAIYGLDGLDATRGQLAAGYAATASTQSPIAAPTVTSPSGGSQTAFTTSSGTLKAAVGATGGTTATWAGASKNDTGQLNLSGFTPATTIPAGSILQSATLQVRHGESATTPAHGTTSIATQLTYTVGGGAAKDVSAQLTTTGTPSALATDSIDLTSALAPYIHKGDATLGNLAVAYSESQSGNGTTNASVDSVLLVLKYFSPVLRGQTTTAIPNNCVATLACNLVDDGSGSNFSGSFVVQGATYIPGAGINLALGNQTQVVSLRWGLVAKLASLQSQNSFPFAYPVVTIPNEGPGFGASVTAVDLKVFLCTGAGPCSTSGAPALTSRVRFTDPVDSATGLLNPAPKTRQVQVLSWAEQR